MPRRELDFHETPPHYIGALLGEVNIYGRVFDACNGEGAISKALEKQGACRGVATNDIDPKRKADYHFDARKPYPFDTDDYEWWITNPPFSDILPILQTAMEYGFHHIVTLARLSFLEPTNERGDWLQQHPPTQIIVLPRYSFRPNDAGEKQTDSVTCAWLYWNNADPTPRRTTFFTRDRATIEAIVRGL